VLGVGAASAASWSASAVPAAANPRGGQVVAGSASIVQTSPARLDILQSSDRAAIDWRSFNIAPSEQTNFRQPAASSVALNRVQAGDPSVIAGRLTANGSIVLINPSGITFSKGAQVNVNSIVATPTGISNANFMAGRMRFDQPSADPRATVINNGTITVAQRGLAALVAPGVANSGVVQAKLGRVVLAGAKTYTVDFYGDGLISFDVGPKVTAAPLGADGQPVKSLVSNSGRVDASGGTVLLTADAVGGIVGNVVDVPGQITARTNGTSRGLVTIDAGVDGAATLSGTIDVSGLKPGQAGGSARVTGGSVTLAATARIDARGSLAGGTVWIGGGPHGRAAAIRNAATTAVAKGAIIDASATGRGNGGQVAVWSDRATRFAGTIRARGGQPGGAGGWVETSGKATLSVLPSAEVDAGAPNGTPGTWLLDPANLTVTAANSNITPPGGSGAMVTPTANNATVSAAVVAATLKGGTSVDLTTVGAPGTQNGDITIAADGALSWATTAGLTLDAAGNISILAPITAASAFIGLTAGGGISQSATGTISASVLDITSVGAVSLPSANAVGTLAFTVSGAGNDFLYRNDKHALVLGFDDGTSDGTDGGNLSVVTTGTSTSGFDLTIPADETVFSTGGNMTFMAGGLGGTFKNSGAVVSTAASPAKAGNIVALADAMSLAAGTLDATTAGASGSVVLGPATAADSVALGAAGSAGVLGLLPADLASITAGGLQVGYRGITGAPLLTGNISIPTPLVIDTAKIASLLLATGGEVAEAPRATITATTGGPLALGIIAGGPVALDQANAVGTVAGFVDGSATDSFLFRDDSAALTIGAVPRMTIGVAFDPTTGVPSSATMTGAATNPLAGVTTAGGNILLETTTAGSLALADPVDAGTGAVGLASAGTVTQDPAPIIASSLGILSADRVSLGAFGGVSDLNKVGVLAGEVLNPGQSFVFRNDAASLTIGTADITDRFGTRLRNPLTGALLTGALSGVVTDDANIGLRVTTSGDLTLAASVAAGAAGIGLESAGAVSQTAGAVSGSTLEVSAVGAVSLPDANAVPVLAGQATGAGSSFLFRDDGLGLTIGTTPTLVETGTGTPPSAQMLSVSGLAGVTAAGGNILLETTTSGSLALADPVDAGAGAVGLASAGTVTQDPAPIIASSLGILSADRVSLGAFGGAADLNKVGVLAGEVLNPGQSFVFRNDAASLTIGTADITDRFGTRLRNPLTGALLTGALSGVATNNANIGLRVTTSGDLTLAASVAAGTAGIGLESAGAVSQTVGAVSGGTLEVSAVGAVSLPDANAVPVLAGQATGAGSSFLFRDDSLALTVGTAPTLVETGTGTPPSAQMLSVAALSGVTTAGGNIALQTTTAGDLTLSQDVDANGGIAALISAGSAFETGGAIVAASGLIVDAAGDVAFGIAETGGTATLGSVNDVGTLAGSAGGVFGFLNGPALTIGTVPAGADVAGQSGIAASAASGGDILVQTTDPAAPLSLAGNLTAGGRTILDTAGAFAQTGTVSVTDPVFAVDTTGSGVPRLLAIVTAPIAGAGAVAGLPPAGITSNPLRFGGLSAAHSTVLLFADRGMLAGTMAVAGLGLSGTGSSASLFGSIAGNSGPTAALLGVRDPGPEPTYLFNDCIIAGTSCFVQPTAFRVVPPQPALEISALIPLPDLAAILDFITPEAVQIRQEPNPEAPVINIYDEERLCDETGTSSEAARERCLERLER
jgi:filamentous hemagglutinin family protein